MPVVEYYATSDGGRPVTDWLNGLDDTTAARVLTRIGRIARGNFGDHKAVGGGVSELRIQFGPGYRVYYARVEATVVLLLFGGDKSTQKRDIKRAKEYLADFQSRTQ